MGRRANEGRQRQNDRLSFHSGEKDCRAQSVIVCHFGAIHSQLLQWPAISLMLHIG